MENTRYTSNYQYPTNNPNKKRYQPSAKCSLELHIPAAIARKRLQEAFVSPAIITKSFFSIKINYAQYTGSLTGNHIDAFFTFFNTKGDLEYHVQGEIIEDFQGSRIEIIVWEKTALFQLTRLLLQVISMYFFTHSFLTAFIVLLFFGVFWFAMSTSNCSSNADTIANILETLVSGKTPPPNIVPM